MGKLSLKALINALYKDNKVFGNVHNYVTIQKTEKDYPINREMEKYGQFDMGSSNWIEYLTDKYTNDSIRFNNSDFMFIHFANIREIVKDFYYVSKDSILFDNNKKIKTYILNATNGRVKHEPFAEVLYNSYEKRRNISKSSKKDDKRVLPESKYANFGEYINAIIGVNKYVVENYCRDLLLLCDIINDLIEMFEMDDSFPLEKDDKDRFLLHIKAYQRKRDESFIDEKSWIFDLSYILSWLLIAALLRESFVKFTKIVPDFDTVVLVRDQIEEEYLKKALNKRIVQETAKILSNNQLKKVDERLFVKGKYYKNDNSYTTSLKDLIQKSWVAGCTDDKNLMVTGEGGIGKTLTVLSVIGNSRYNVHNIPAIYIPLNKLGGFDYLPVPKCAIEKNISWYIKTHYKDEHESIENLCRKKDISTPEIIIFLDGYNEINVNYQYQVLQDIREWEELSAVQLIVTSRSSFDHRGNFGLFVADSLNEEIVESYLSINKIDFNGDRRLLSTPLLLQLCCQSERVRNVIDQEYIKQLNWHEIKSASDIFWNYLQFEIYRCHEKHTFKGADGIRENDYVYLILLLCPYISWKMVDNQVMHLSDIDLKNWISEALDYLESEENIYDDWINSIRRHTDGVFDNDRSRSVREDIFNLIFANMNILMKKDEGGISVEYSLLHQNIRDYLAALFLNNVIFRDNKHKGFLSNYITKTGDIEILTYLSEIVEDEDILKLWEKIKISDVSVEEYQDNKYINAELYADSLKNQDTKIMIKKNYKIFWDYRKSVNWFLNFWGIMYNNDYSQINFSNMDLTYISLADCRSGSIQLTLSKDSEKFNNTRLSNYTFHRIGHTKKVNAICVIQELNICISGDSDGKVYAWDLNNNKFLFVLDCYGLEIWEIQYYNYKNNYYVAICTDHSIDIFIINNEMLEDENYNWIPPQYTIIHELVGEKECHSLRFYQDECLYIFFASIDGVIGRYNIDTNELHYFLSKKNIAINKIEIFEENGELFCITANEDFSLDVLNVRILKRHKHIKVKSKKMEKDPFSYIEDSNSEAKDVWNNKLIGITDYKLYKEGEKFNIIFSDSNGGIHIAKNVFGNETKSHLLGNSYGHSKCVNMIELFDMQDEKWAVTCSNDHTIARWNISTEKLIGKKLMKHSDWIAGIKKIDKYNLLSYGHDNTVYKWNILTGECIELQGKTVDWILCGDTYKKFGDTWFVTGDASGTISTWNIEETRREFRFPGFLSNVLDIKAFKRNDGYYYLAIASADGVARIWNLNKSKCVATLEGHEGWINAIFPCCDGNKIITCGSDKTVKIFDINNLDMPTVKSLEGHSDWVLDVNIISDDNTFKFATCSYDGTFILWEKYFDSYKATRVGYDLREENNKATKYENHDIKLVHNSINIHKAGIKVIRIIDKNRLLTGGYDGKVVVWSLNDLENDIGIQIGQHDDWVRDIVCVREDNDKYILSTGVDGKIIKYDFNDLKKVDVFYLKINKDENYVLEKIEEDKSQKYKNNVSDDKNENKLISKDDNVFFDKILKTDEDFIALSNKHDIVIFSSNILNCYNKIKNKNQRLFEINRLRYNMKTTGITNIAQCSENIYITVKWDDEIGMIRYPYDFGKINVIEDIFIDNEYEKLFENEKHDDEVYDGLSDIMSTIDKINAEIDEGKEEKDEKIIDEMINAIKLLEKKYTRDSAIILHGISVVGLDFSKAIFTKKELKVLLEQNGAIVD